MKNFKARLGGLGFISIKIGLCLSSAVPAAAQLGAQPGLQIGAHNWGRVTAPVFGTSEQGIYAGAELFAGPNKFGSYFNGVLPNGRIVRPAGASVQIGMNPLGVALTRRQVSGHQQR